MTDKEWICIGYPDEENIKQMKYEVETVTRIQKEIKELGVGEYIRQHKEELTKEDLYRLLFHFDFAVQNFCRHYIGMSKEDYDIIVDNMNDDIEFVDDFCYKNEGDFMTVEQALGILSEMWSKDRLE